MIDAKEVIIGKNVKIADSVIISGWGKPADKIVIGDNVTIDHDVKILMPELILGDFVKINNHAFFQGQQSCHIGHNSWFGQNCVINSSGKLSIGNNFAIGLYGTIWNHVQFGCQLEGCQYTEAGYDVDIGNDVWLCGRVSTCMRKAEDKSMALDGSIVRQDMKYNRVYSGNPAIDVTDKVKAQFGKVTIEQKIGRMREYLFDYKNEGNSIDMFRPVTGHVKDGNPCITYFNVDDRTYTKRGTVAETAFMNWLLPLKAKFVPRER